MTCARYHQLISRYVDSEVTPRQRQELLAHVQSCRECAAFLAKARQTDVLLKELNDEGPSDRVRSAVLNSIRSGATTPPTKQNYTPPPPQSKHARHKPRTLRIGGLRFGAAGLLLRFDPSARTVAFGIATTLAAILCIAYATGTIQPLIGYTTLGFEFPNAARAVGATPLPAVSQGYNGVGGPVAVPNALNIVPPPSAVAVQTTATLGLRFDQPMDQTSVESALNIEPPLAGAYKWNADNEVSFVPGTGGLLSGVTYTVTLSNTARALSGTPLREPVQWSFRTREPHIVEPGVEANSTVPLTQTFSLHFDTPMNVAPAANGITLYSEYTGAKLPATLQIEPGGQVVTLRPTGILAPGKVSVRVAASTLTAAGDELGRAYEFAYTASQSAPSLRLAGGRVRVLQADRDVAAAYSDRAVSATYTIYKLPVERLSELSAQARTWPNSLPGGYPAVLQYVDFLHTQGNSDDSTRLPVIQTLAPGMYLLYAQAATQAGTADDWQLLIIEDRSLAPIEGVPGAMWATNEAGQPWNGAEVSLYSAEGNLVEKGATNGAGLWQPTSAAQLSNVTLAVARDAEGHLAANLLAPQTASIGAPPANTLAASLQTDRQSYLPGQTVNFRVLLKPPAPVEATPDPNTGITVQLSTQGGALLSTLVLKPDSAGGVGGIFAISPQISPGTYLLTVQEGQASRDFPLIVTAPRSDSLNLAILPSADYTVSNPLALTRTVSVLDDAGLAAAGTTLTATLGITGDDWASQPVTATADSDGQAVFAVPLPAWAARYTEPGLYLAVEAVAGTKQGSDTQYLDLAVEGESGAAEPHLVAPAMNVEAWAHTNQDGSTDIYLDNLAADLGSLSTGDVLLEAQGSSGAQLSQVVSLQAGITSVRLPAEYEGGAIGILRSGQQHARRLQLATARSRDLTLNVAAPITAQVGTTISVALQLKDAGGQALAGVASVWMRRAAPGADSSEQQTQWEPSIRLDATQGTALTLTMPTTPGLWSIVAQAADQSGQADQAQATVRVLPGLTLQAPSTAQAQDGKDATFSVVAHNPTTHPLAFSVTASAGAGLTLQNGRQGGSIEPGGRQRLVWTYTGAAPGQTLLHLQLTGDSSASGSYDVPVQVAPSQESNATYTSGQLTGERDIEVQVPSGLASSGVHLEIRAATSLLSALDGMALELPAAGPQQGGVAQAAALLAAAPAVNAAHRRAEGADKAALKQSATERSLLLQQLYSAQHKDGGWGTDLDGAGAVTSASQVESTVSVLTAIRRLNLASADETSDTQALPAVSETVIQRGLQYLSAALGRPLGAAPGTAALDVQAEGLYALALYGIAAPEQIRPLMAYAGETGASPRLSNAGLAWLASALWQAGDTDDALVVFDRAIAGHKAVDAADEAALAPMLELALSAGEAERNAVTPRAGHKRDAGAYDTLAQGYANELMSLRQGLGWSNYGVTAAAIWSLSLLAEQQPPQNKPGVPSVTINDLQVQMAPSTAGGQAADYAGDASSVSVLLSGDTLHAGANLLKLFAPTQDGTLYYSLTLKADK